MRHLRLCWFLVALAASADAQEHEVVIVSGGGENSDASPSSDNAAGGPTRDARARSNADQSVPQIRLPSPTSDPLAIALREDPVFRHLQTTVSAQDFSALIERAVLAHPIIDEARAGRASAEAGRREARSNLFPTVEVALSNRASIARNFSNDPDNVIERSRSTSRTDATFNLQQLILDFGATSHRINAAGARLQAAEFEIERQTEEAVLNAVVAWYDVLIYRALVDLSEEFAERQDTLLAALLMRVDQGVSARVDLARLESFVANHNANLAGYRRQLADAEARFLEYFDTWPPVQIARAPISGRRFASIDSVQYAARNSSVVRLVESQARASLRDARAARAATLPTVSAGIEGGRFGLFDSGNDYDVRGTISVRHRFLGGADAQADQARAEASAARARSERIRREALRRASTAWTGLNALDDQLLAVEQNYLSSRQSRDAILERFRVARGTLFDVITVEEEFLNAAIRYIQTTAERDITAYLLLARTGELLNALHINFQTRNSGS